MNEDMAFLQAISEDRHNEGLRLVYADWLEERGDQRAEYLRLECELVRTWWYDNQRPALYARLAKLAKAISPGWLAAVRRCTTPAPPVDVTRAIPSLQGLEKTTVRLHPRPGKGAAGASKIGGLFLWPQAEPWPECDQHQCPFVPALQLRKQDVPEVGFRTGTDLFQVLWCPHDHEPQYCPALKVFWRNAGQIQKPLDSHPASSGRKGVIAQWDWYIPKPCILYPERVVGYPDPFEHRPDIQDGEALEGALNLITGDPIEPWSYPEDIEHLYQVILSTADGTKIGGYPDWVQHPAYPQCSCGTVMECLVNFDSREYDGVTWGRWLPIQDRPTLTAAHKKRESVSEAAGWMFGDAGCMYLFICRNCKEWPIRWGMQCS